MLIGDLLSEFGYEVVGPAGDVEAALALVAGEGETLDGALLDVVLGRSESYPIAVALDRIGVPYAFVTGHGLGGLDAAFHSARTLAKPFTPDELQAMAARLVALRRR